MINGIEITEFYFDTTGYTNYVLIRADVGKMPPERVKKYLEHMRNELSLCKVLDELDIAFDLVGVRNVGSQVKPIEESSFTGTSKEALKHLESFERSIKMQRGSKVEKLPGGQGLGELINDDLEYFQKKLERGLEPARKALAFDNAMKIIED